MRATNQDTHFRGIDHYSSHLFKLTPSNMWALWGEKINKLDERTMATSLWKPVKLIQVVAWTTTDSLLLSEDNKDPMTITIAKWLTTPNYKNILQYKMWRIDGQYCKEENKPLRSSSMPSSTRSEVRSSSLMYCWMPRRFKQREPSLQRNNTHQHWATCEGVCIRPDYRSVRSFI